MLRAHAHRSLDASVDGFDLFTGLWWPLRDKRQDAPRRTVAWLVAKLYASCPVRHSPGDELAAQLRRCSPQALRNDERFGARFDGLVRLPIERIESDLGWALRAISNQGLGVDWVQLTNDLSGWDRERVRRRWASQFLGFKGRSKKCS